MKQSLRATLGIFLLGMILLYLLSKAWFPTNQDEHLIERNEKQSGQALVQDRMLHLQTSVALGVEKIISKEQTSTNSDVTNNALQKTLEKELLSMLEMGDKSDAAPNPASCKLTAKELILARHFGFKELRDKKLALILEKCNSHLNSTALQIIEKSATLESNNYIEINEDEQKLLITEFGLWGNLLISETSANEQVRNQAYTASRTGTEATALKVLFLFALIGVGALLSILSFITFIFLIFFKKIKSHKIVTTVPNYLLLEVFCLYLLGMIILPDILAVAKLLGVPDYPYLGTAFGIVSLLLVVFWLPLNGCRLSSSLHAVALNRPSFVSILKEPFLGLVSYLAAWVPLGVVLILYSALLQQFSTSPTSGMHPIVPIVLSDNGSTSIIPIMLFLTVIIAPLVEEIMFRGALFGYLRAHCGAVASILISSFIFAAIHPQGILGIIPLMAIGIILGTVREWRGGLLAPMVTHALVNGVTMTLLLVFLA